MLLSPFHHPEYRLKKLCRVILIISILACTNTVYRYLYTDIRMGGNRKTEYNFRQKTRANICDVMEDWYPACDCPKYVYNIAPMCTLAACILNHGDSGRIGVFKRFPTPLLPAPSLWRGWRREEGGTSAYHAMYYFLGLRMDP